MKNYFFLGLLLFVLSCKKENVQVQRNVQRTIASANLIYEETFEGTPFATYVSKQFATTYAFGVVTSPVYSGSKAGRFELRDTDPMANSGTRAEINTPIPSPFIKQQWYSFSVYFPSSDYQYDSKSELIYQQHQGGGTSPSTALETRADRYRLIIRPLVGVQEKTDLGAIKKDSWNTFVFHYIHSASSDGLVEIWLNGSKIFTKNGRNMYDVTGDFNYPHPKFGIYKWDWNGTETTDVSKRVLFFDNIRIGNASATYADMTGVIQPPVDTVVIPKDTVIPQVPSKFTLINAATDVNVISISEGMAISLSKYNLTSINIKADVTGVSAKFELSGTQIYTYVDNLIPFALFGDDGKGNFYHNNFIPKVGTYTLKVTPYSGLKATGTASPSSTIKFTFVN